MKHGETRHNELDVLDHALEALQLQTGLKSQVLQIGPRLREEPGLGPRVADALIQIQGHERPLRFIAEIKLVDRFETIAQVRALRPPGAHPPLILVAPYITAETAERCRVMRLFFLDTAGNAYIDLPGFHLFVVGRKRPADFPLADRGRVNNPAALKVVFAILGRPNLLNSTYRQIAETARVALGTVGPVIKDLEARKHIATFGAGREERRLLDPERLLKEWVEFYPATLRPKLNPRRFRGPKFGWAERRTLGAYGAYWGGEVAAHRLTGYLKPQAMTIYVQHRPTQLIADCRLRADARGDVEILDVFWNPEKIPHKPDLVPPILAYADLMATTEGRNLEAAKLIYDEHIAPALAGELCLRPGRRATAGQGCSSNCGSRDSGANWCNPAIRRADQPSPDAHASSGDIEGHKKPANAYDQRDNAQS
jgi:hypothetical protein